MGYNPDHIGMFSRRNGSRPGSTDQKAFCVTMPTAPGSATAQLLPSALYKKQLRVDGAKHGVGSAAGAGFRSA